MKYFSLAICAYVFSLSCIGQTDSIKTMDDLILQIDQLVNDSVSITSSFVDSRKEHRLARVDLINAKAAELYRKLDLSEPQSVDSLKLGLQPIHGYKSMFEIRQLLRDTILIAKANSKNSIQPINIDAVEQNFEAVDEHMKEVVEESYHFYGFRDHVNQSFKSFHAFHDNDVFLFSPIQQDRDYTGGFRFELVTDRLKIQMLNWFNTDKILSYQSFFFGGEGYTPSIRFTAEEMIDNGVLYEVDPNTGFLSEESLTAITGYLTERQEATDRPFASYQYIGRGKYRLHYKGWGRSRSFLKLGYMGKNVGENIQAVIHQDLTIDSQRVLNWDRQIAQGGRFVFNIEHGVDLSVFSNNCIFHPRSDLGITDRVNIYVPLEGAWGTSATYLGGGLGFMTSSFIDVNDFNDRKYDELSSSVPFFQNKQPFWNKLKHQASVIWDHIDFSAEYKFRRVFHNSALQGVGFLNKSPDDPLDDEAITLYTLNNDDVSDYLHSLKLKLNVRLKRMSFYYAQTRLLNKEFEVQAPDGVNPDKFQTRTGYGWGTFGFNFYL